MNQNILVGKTLKSIYLAEDRQAIKFEMEGGDVIVRCDAECCSYTWVEHIELPALGFPAVVTAVEDLDMPEGKPSEFHTDPDSLQFYGCKISTDRGEIVIDYRNDSNGYYGGNLSWPGGEYEHFYGGVYGQNVSKEQWKQVA